MVGWAHAGTDARPSHHGIRQRRNMVSGGVRHWFNPKATVYLVYAWLATTPGAPMRWDPAATADLGPARTGGSVDGQRRSRDGFVGTAPAASPAPPSQAFSLGMTYDF